MLIDIIGILGDEAPCMEKVSAATKPPPIALTPKEMQGLLTVLGIGGVMTLMSHIGNQEDLEARRQEAMMRAEVRAAENNKTARAAELARSRGLTAQHMRMSLMNRGVFVGGDDPMSAPFVTAAASQSALPQSNLPKGAIAQEMFNGS